MKKFLVSVLIVSLLTSCSFFGKQETKVEPTRDPLIVQLATNVAELQKKESVPQNIAATPVPSAPTSPAQVVAPVEQPQGCPQARDLGPWAPSNGQGEDFEVTASDGDSNGVVLGLWWPKGNTDWETKEITTFIPRGLSVTVLAGAGRGWDYEVLCSSEEIQKQMQDHMSQRNTDTTYHGFIEIDKLISMKLVKVRFDRRQGMVNPTP